MAKTAEQICANVSKEIKPQAVTLAKAVLALQAKIEQQLPVYERLPLAQTATTTQGEKVLKNNPAMQEFRCVVRDYATALKELQTILDDNKTMTEVESLDLLRSRFNIV